MAHLFLKPFYIDTVSSDSLSSLAHFLNLQKRFILFDLFCKFDHEHQADQLFTLSSQLSSLLKLFLHDHLGFPVVLPLAQVYLRLNLPLFFLILPMRLSNF